MWPLDLTLTLHLNVTLGMFDYFCCPKVNSRWRSWVLVKYSKSASFSYRFWLLGSNGCVWRLNLGWIWRRKKLVSEAIAAKHLYWLRVWKQHWSACYQQEQAGLSSFILSAQQERDRIWPVQMWERHYRCPHRESYPSGDWGARRDCSDNGYFVNGAVGGWITLDDSGCIPPLPQPHSTPTRKHAFGNCSIKINK